mmetsp:Transcript_72833/g.204570  ORF Transcript_72833/g.204570 Transcript_72833/m.204570 type:complete len:248 (+) Transcript_72833:557-1300(+)
MGDEVGAAVGRGVLALRLRPGGLAGGQGLRPPRVHHHAVQPGHEAVKGARRVRRGRLQRRRAGVMEPGLPELAGGAPHVLELNGGRRAGVRPLVRRRAPAEVPGLGFPGRAGPRGRVATCDDTHAAKPREETEGGGAARAAAFAEPAAMQGGLRPGHALDEVGGEARSPAPQWHGLLAHTLRKDLADPLWASYGRRSLVTWCTVCGFVGHAIWVGAPPRRGPAPASHAQAAHVSQALRGHFGRRPSV